MSELYASMLMIGVTLSLGSIVAAAALSQFGLANGAATADSTARQSAASVELGLVYVAVSPSGSCPVYEGNPEGSTLKVSLYNYGAAPFSPSEFMVNSSVYPGAYPTLGAGSLGSFTISLGGCAHSSGQTLLVLDTAGEGAQVWS